MKCLLFQAGHFIGIQRLVQNVSLVLIVFATGTCFLNGYLSVSKFFRRWFPLAGGQLINVR